MKQYDNGKTRAVIDMGALIHNYQTAKRKANGASVAAVIKADAYGHGAVRTAKTLEKQGCSLFAVSNIDEAMELRDAGISASILILGYVREEMLPLAVENDISLAVDTSAHLQKIIAAANGKTAKLHIKLDTGMNRTGVRVTKEAMPTALTAMADIIKSHENLVVEGLFSHFAMADEEDGEAFTDLQFARFTAAKQALAAVGIVPKYCHIANSAGIERYPLTHMDMVRMGITLYGGTEDADYLPVMSFKTIIVNIHDLPKGEYVGYGCRYEAKQDRRVAVIGAGYADGYFRVLSEGRGYVLIRGKKAPILGRVCMDMTMVDITGLENAAVGDDVLLFGKDEHGNELKITELARCAGTISYELMCAVSKRVPRIEK